MCRRQSRVWSKLAGTEEEAAVWTGWTAFSSRAFQNLPGASLKQREEEEEVGLPAGMLQTNHDPIGTATFNVDRRSTVTLYCNIMCIYYRSPPSGNSAVSSASSILSNLLQHKPAVRRLPDSPLLIVTPGSLRSLLVTNRNCNIKLTDFLFTHLLPLARCPSKCMQIFTELPENC